MATRTGDATAELLSLLREHCPGVAEETLALLAASIVAAGATEGQSVDDDDGALRWRQLTLGSIPMVQQVIGIVSPPVKVISTVLQVASGILDVISALLIGIPDPFRALILAAYELLKTLIDDLLGSGAYVYVDAPGLLTNQAALVNLGMPEPDLPRWLAGDKPALPAAPADGFAAWASRFRQSFDDAGDEQRPQFSDGAPVEAVFLVATGGQLPDLASLATIFTKLLDMKAFSDAFADFGATFPQWPDDPDRSRLRSRSVYPDWQAWRLRDIGPDEYPLRSLEKIPELLKALLLNGDSIVDLIRALIAAIKQKIVQLQEIVAVIEQIIDLLRALSATGLHVLAVATDAGVDGLVDAFIGAENRPNTGPHGKPRKANAIVGVCLLAGGSELDPAAALPVWTLLGQQGAMDQAFGSLTDDLTGLGEQAALAASDAAAAASDAWHGLEKGGDTPQDQGLQGLFAATGAEWEQQKDRLLAVLGVDAAEADEGARDGRNALVTALEQSHAAGTRLDPLALANIEATRRARRRGSRSLAMSIDPRQAPANPGSGTTPDGGDRDSSGGTP